MASPRFPSLVVMSVLPVNSFPPVRRRGRSSRLLRARVRLSPGPILLLDEPRRILVLCPRSPALLRFGVSRGGSGSRLQRSPETLRSELSSPDQETFRVRPPRRRVVTFHATWGSVKPRLALGGKNGDPPRSAAWVLGVDRPRHGLRPIKSEVPDSAAPARETRLVRGVVKDQ
jgi:hypothetical protein